jgi:hypothetical protein
MFEREDRKERERRQEEIMSFLCNLCVLGDLCVEQT